MYPKIKVELINEYASVDIVAKGHYAGVRFGEELAKDMISVRMDQDVRNTRDRRDVVFQEPQTAPDGSRSHRVRLHQTSHECLVRKKRWAQPPRPALRRLLRRQPVKLQEEIRPKSTDRIQPPSRNRRSQTAVRP
ncbi:hypothetical protein [Caballeronia novacaledonica]|uniref:Uncharacterized protein n=1 Tax=Caballeronia novacaledonica TaxID=1544861 RepID=A0AA37IIP3_9BURK|nr:hypothetical protein [Caballeronia novacaledonica]GJH30053.1 hypothetical protein CBA19CS42_36075 [Caballeronia novacaledonica]